ncbi:ComEC/Rec2 family competence protein [Phormidium sp. CLA17]|uniref:ComEC/Rec2 family competence protein n=1 Tax=Leptolyngbya sp. Cla-17 TaxID=2803751 RepID=UPI001490CC77|nr:ComEC/Rec2 family competence protein [Leptolyngbya sp. Cla-17]MBM0741605.1 ComEC/Rec2 family competence protein [Leptolyngbya sp. Cla-17]
MGSVQAIAGCLAYILGLLATALPWGGWVLLIGAIGIGLTIRRVWRGAPKFQVWLVAGAIALSATFYFQARIPHPAANDISQLATPDSSTNVLVEGRISSLPRLTRSQKSQFWLEAKRIAPIGEGKPVSGRLYVTVPPDQATDLHPGQIVGVDGALYLPKAATNPGGFDFKDYLQQEGSFAGLRGKQVSILKPSTGWGWWQVQQRIARSQLAWVGNPEGALISSMVLGSKAVDLPYDVKDAFVRVGLAHALAASGFQTSLILGVVLALTRRFSERVQFLAGTMSLASFVGLAGLQPAVLRAAFMGFGGLIALVLGRKVKPLGSMLMTATMLLVINPQWIWNLGFQLSFLATMGLLVTVPPLTKKLDWVPSAIAPLIAVPIAAYLWTLPLQLGAFGVLSPYSIPVNILTSPFISLISLGGMLSALASLIWSPAGSALAWLLKYPTQGLIAIVDGFAQLPGNGFAVGTISVLAVIGLYALLGLATVHPFWQRRWWIALALGLVVTLIPIGMGANLMQVTVLAAERDPVLVIRDRGRVAVVNSNDEKTVQFTLLPFLQKAGVNQIHLAIALHANASMNGWQTLLEKIPIKTLVASSMPPGRNAPSKILPFNQGVRLGAIQVRVLQAEPDLVAQIMLGDQTWLWLGNLNANEQESLLKTNIPSAQVLLWSSASLSPVLVDRVRPKTAIASGKGVNPETIAYLKQQNISLYQTQQDGGIQWTPDGGFNIALDSNASGL